MSPQLGVWQCGDLPRSSGCGSVETCHNTVGKAVCEAVPGGGRTVGAEKVWQLFNSKTSKKCIRS